MSTISQREEFETRSATQILMQEEPKTLPLLTVLKRTNNKRTL